ncbi:AMP-binding protein, partial [Thalassotalea sp. 1_MG-2023]|uniref:AMP-binding protein n=1 Tax=Thalassotalea sp. 1_MG-2023 TaxID=3062680 RepID=UPI0026E14B7A
NESLHQLLEAKATEQPNAIAVVGEGTQLSYEALNTQANQLAHYLREARGVAKEELIGICLPRGPQLMVAILAVLKAGGAYVPLDADYPTERLTMMLDDAALRTVLTIEALADAPWLSSPTVMALDNITVQAELETQPTRNLSLVSEPTQLAYVMYTSGSTGTPKGVMVEHGNVVSLVCDVDYVEINRDTVT